MIFTVEVVGPFQANCYILGCPTTREALVIDPGDEPDRLAAFLEQHRLQPVVYFHTHGHLDHVGATAPLQARFGGRILLHADDRFLYEQADQHARAYGLTLAKPALLDGLLADGERVTWGTTSATVLHTPGHSPGGVCLQVPAAALADVERPAAGAAEPAAWLFTGDTLFAGSIGRSDLPGGNGAQLLQSIRTRLLPLPPETVVAPGHGPLSTIGAERRGNPFLQEPD